MPVLSKPLVDILNKCEPGQRLMLFVVPLRIVRVLAVDESFMTFRVEQLVMTSNDRNNPRGNWTTLSTHGGQVAGAAYPEAAQAAMEAQKNLRRKLQQRRKQLLVPA